MHLAVYLPLLFSGIFGLVAPAIGRRLPPATSTWLLSVGGLIVAAGSGAALCLLAFTLVGQNPLVGAVGRWSTSALWHEDPVPAAVAAGAAAALAVLIVRCLAAAARRLAALRQAHALAAALSVTSGELVVVEGSGLHAYAVPGRPGRVVVSVGLLRALDADQRRAVLAHERAHLVHRHHLHHTLALVAAAANPLLGRLPAAVALSTERWADERAAATATRAVVVAALTRIADGRPVQAGPAVVLAVGATDVTTRLDALRAPPPKLTWWRVAVLLALLGVVAATTLEAAHDTEHLFESAQHAGQTHAEPSP